MHRLLKHREVHAVSQWKGFPQSPAWSGKLPMESKKLLSSHEYSFSVLLECDEGSFVCALHRKYHVKVWIREDCMHRIKRSPKRKRNTRKLWFIPLQPETIFLTSSRDRQTAKRDVINCSVTLNIRLKRLHSKCNSKSQLSRRYFLCFPTSSWISFSSIIISIWKSLLGKSWTATCSSASTRRSSPVTASLASWNCENAIHNLCSYQCIFHPSEQKFSILKLFTADFFSHQRFYGIFLNVFFAAP